MAERHVSPGTYAGVAATFIVAGITLVGITTNVALGATLLVLGGLCLFGAWREWYRRERTSTPDVHLQFSPPNTLVAQNAGAPAAEIRVDPISTGDYVSSYLSNFAVPQRGTVTGPVIRKAVTAEFGVLSDLYDATPLPFPLTVRDGAAGLLLMRQNLTMNDFLHAALERRKCEELQHLQERRGAPLLGAELDATANHLSRPLDIHLRLTFWDRAKSRRWEKQERIRYEPRTNQAYVLHGKRRRIA